MNRKWFIVLLVMVFVLFVIAVVRPFKEKGTYEELILDKFENYSFSQVIINKYSEDLRKNALLTNSDDISNLNNVFKELELVEVNQTSEEMAEYESYVIFATNEVSAVFIRFWKNSSYLKVTFEDGKDIIRKNYKIIDGEIGFDVLEVLIDNNTI